MAPVVDPPVRRVQPRFLLRSRWTAERPLPDSAGERHFMVVATPRRGGGDAVTVRAVLTGRQYRVARAALDDVAAWTPGWRSLA